MNAHTTADPEGYPMAATEQWQKTGPAPTRDHPHDHHPVIGDRMEDAEKALQHLLDTIDECEQRLATVLTPDKPSTADTAPMPPAPAQSSSVYYRTAELAQGILHASNRLVSLLRRVDV
jgi:hypothetical protein